MAGESGERRVARLKMTTYSISLSFPHEIVIRLCEWKRLRVEKWESSGIEETMKFHGAKGPWKKLKVTGKFAEMRGEKHEIKHFE